MKKLIGFVLFLLLLVYCQKENNNIIENRPWLKDLIKKAEKDKTGNYLGCIWLEKYKGQDIFVTNMMLGSGGILEWYFDNSGNHFVFKEQGDTPCSACKYVGNHHVFIEDLFDHSTPFVKTKNVIVYSPNNKNDICK